MYISDRRGFRKARFIRMSSKPTPASKIKHCSYMLVEVTMKDHPALKLSTLHVFSADLP